MTMMRKMMMIVTARIGQYHFLSLSAHLAFISVKKKRKDRGENRLTAENKQRVFISPSGKQKSDKSGKGEKIQNL